MSFIKNVKAAAAAGAKGYNAAKATATKTAAEILKKKEEAIKATKDAANAAAAAKKLTNAEKGAAAYKNVKVAAGSATAGAAGGAYAMNKYNKNSAEEAKLKNAAYKQIKKDMPTWMVKSLDKKKKGGSTKSFPDLNKDGKVTKADILKGRGVIKKTGGSINKMQKGGNIGALYNTVRKLYKANSVTKKVAKITKPATKAIKNK